MGFPLTMEEHSLIMGYRQIPLWDADNPLPKPEVMPSRKVHRCPGCDRWISERHRRESLWGQCKDCENRRLSCP